MTVRILRSALDFLLGSVGPLPESGGSGRRRFQEEVAALQRWAASCGRCLNEDDLRGFEPVASGAGHEVFFDENRQLAIKFTRDGRSCQPCGRWQGLLSNE